MDPFGASPPGALFTSGMPPLGPTAGMPMVAPPIAPIQPPVAPLAAPVVPPMAPAPADEWRTSGHPLVGRDLVRLIEGTAQASTAKVVGWLDAHESDFNDDEGKPAALFHIKYTGGVLNGDEEDLEQHEVEASIKIESDDDVEDAAAGVLSSLPKPSTAPLGAAPPAPAPAPPPPDNHPGRLIDPREVESGPTEVKFIPTNPKRAATACHLRYENYKDAKTVAEFFEKGGWRADLIHDVAKNYCALGGAEPTGVPPPPTKPRKSVRRAALCLTTRGETPRLGRGYRAETRRGRDAAARSRRSRLVGSARRGPTTRRRRTRTGSTPRRRTTRRTRTLRPARSAPRSRSSPTAPRASAAPRRPKPTPKPGRWRSRSRATRAATSPPPRRPPPKRPSCPSCPSPSRRSRPCPSQASPSARRRPTPRRSAEAPRPERSVRGPLL